MSKISDGGKAFPQHVVGEITKDVYSLASNAGMTLRGYFAGQALANPKICDSDTEGWHANNAKYAVGAADALIAELARETS